jgi:hypothetical protein
MPEPKAQPPAYDEALRTRKSTRRYMRENGTRTANEMADELRVGDQISLRGEVTYVVLKATWWTFREDDQDGDHPAQSPFGNRTLIRHGEGRLVCLSDPRTAWEDEDGALWRPTGGHELLVERNPTLPGVLKGDSGTVSARLAGDEDFLRFASELDDVRRAFAEMLTDEAAEFADAAVIFEINDDSKK